MNISTTIENERLRREWALRLEDVQSDQVVIAQMEQDCLSHKVISVNMNFQPLAGHTATCECKYVDRGSVIYVTKTKELNVRKTAASISFEMPPGLELANESFYASIQAAKLGLAARTHVLIKEGQQKGYIPTT